jgi:hypothetical protein
MFPASTLWVEDYEKTPSYNWLGVVSGGWTWECGKYIFCAIPGKEDPYIQDNQGRWYPRT